jgi:hypothetical protein
MAVLWVRLPVDAMCPWANLFVLTYFCSCSSVHSFVRSETLYEFGLWGSWFRLIRSVLDSCMGCRPDLGRRTAVFVFFLVTREVWCYV